MITCKNCKAPVDGKYCASCGQSAAVKRFTLSSLLHEIMHAITHADRNIFRLVREMVTRPGQAAGQYLQGRRRSCFNPFVYFLIMLGLQVFVFGLLNPEPEEFSSLQQKEAYAVQAFMHKSLRILYAVLLPLVGLLSLLFYRRHNYTEYIVINIFIAGTLSLISTAGMLIFSLIEPGDSVVFYMQFLIPIIYTSWFFANLYPQMPVWKVILYQVLITLIYSWITIQVQKVMVNLLY